MQGTSQNNPTTNGDSPLKTTTWGARLALLALVTLLAAVMLLNEPVSAITLIGGLLVLLSVFVTQRAQA